MNERPLTHRPRFALLRRRCVCGLRWPCPDARLQAVRDRYRTPPPDWRTAPTAAYPQTQPGRAGNLTPAQRFRAGPAAARYRP